MKTAPPSSVAELLIKSAPIILVKLPITYKAPPEASSPSKSTEQFSNLEFVMLQ